MIWLCLVPTDGVQFSGTMHGPVPFSNVFPLSPVLHGKRPSDTPHLPSQRLDRSRSWPPTSSTTVAPPQPWQSARTRRSDAARRCWWRTSGGPIGRSSWSGCGNCDLRSRPTLVEGRGREGEERHGSEEEEVRWGVCGMMWHRFISMYSHLRNLCKHL